jgi:spore maturation protein CgeB
MRILVVGAIKGGSVPIGRAIYSAFRETGQEADFLDYSDLLEEFIQVGVAKNTEGTNQFLLKCKIRLLEKVVHFRPEVIFGVAQSPLNNIEALSELKKADIILCYWFVEDYRIFEYWKTIAPYFDHFFTIQKDPFWKQLNQMGCHNHHYLPVAFDSNLEFLADEGNHKIPVSFVGAPYANRVHLFGKLRRPDFQIYGEGWDEHANPAVVMGDRRITEKEARAIYQRSIININLHSSAFGNEFGGGDFVNPRTFELAGLGAFQLTDMRRLLTLHFDPANEVLALGSWEDTERAIEYFLEHQEEREAFAKKAQERVLKEHTYKHRAQEIVSLLS